jgi:hypothetical protein
MNTRTNTERTHRAKNALTKCAREYPHAWANAERLRAAKGGPGFDWPDWCYLPLAGAYAIVSGGSEDRLPMQKVADVARVGALATWRMTQGIYRFDPAVYSAVVETPVAGDLPGEVLLRMPEWCVYVETPGMDGSLGVVHGFWAHLESDANNGRAELRLLLDVDPQPVAVPLHIGPWPLAESIDRAVDLAGVQAMTAGLQLPSSEVGRLWRGWVEPMVSLLLYLCTTNDIVGKQGIPGNPSQKRTRRDGWRLFAADGPRTWDVGVRMGRALRAAYQSSQTHTEGGNTSPRGHVRRAHWHGFRSGPRKDEQGADIPTDKRAFELRWMPPIAVNLPDVEKLPATIRPVFPVVGNQVS